MMHHTPSWVMMALCLATAATTAAEVTFTSPTMLCTKERCGFSFTHCIAHLECLGITQCRENCLQESTKLNEVQCENNCLAGAGRGLFLWVNMNQCFITKCPTTLGQERCRGYVDNTLCNSISGCFFLDDTCQFTDPLPPVFQTCPLDITKPVQENANTQLVSWPAVVAVDAGVNVAVVQVSGGASGSAFPVGATAVRFSATDGAGNTGFCDFTVNITDVWRPEITHCPSSFSINTVPGDIQRASDGRPLVLASWVQPTATDNVDFAWTADSPAAPSSLLPVGVSTIVYTAADAAGNTAVCTFDVTIEPTSLSYFSFAQQFSIEDSSEGGFFAGFVPLEACAERCLLSPLCKSFSVDREGKSSCSISHDDHTHADYKFDFSRNYYGRLNVTSQGCGSGYADADKCFKDSGLTPATASGLACSDALATYTTCVDLAVLRCEDQAFLDQVAAVKASYTLICMGDPEPPITFPAAAPFQCDGPFTEVAACIGCCQQEYADNLQECFHVDGISGKAAVADADCKAARWAMLVTCDADCVDGRPYTATAPGSKVSDGKLVNITVVSGVPPTGFVDIAVNFLVGGVSTTWDAVLAGELVVASSMLYGFDSNHVHIASHPQGAEHNVTLTARVSDTFVPKAPPAPTRRRRSVSGGEASDGVAMTLAFAEPVAVFSTESARQRGRRSVTTVQALLDIITSSTSAPLYAQALVALLKTAEPDVFATVTVTMTSGAVVELSLQGALDLVASQVTTAAPTTTVAPQATVTTTDALSGNTSGSGQTTAAPTAANQVSSGVVIAIVICVILVLIVGFLVLAALFKRDQKKARRQKQPVGGARLVSARQTQAPGRGSVAPAPVLPGQNGGGVHTSGGEFHGVVLPNIVSRPGSGNRVAPLRPGAMPHEAGGQHTALPHAQNSQISANIARSLPTLKAPAGRPSPAGPAFRRPAPLARPAAAIDPFADTGLAHKKNDDPFGGAGL